VVVEDDCRDGDEEASGGRDQCFSDAWCHGAEAGCAGVPETGKGVNDAPNRAEEADEGSNRAGGGQPGHAFFDAADLFRGRELHTDGDGLEALQFSSGLWISSADLAQKFAIASSINRSEWRAGGSERLRVSYAFGGAKDSKELIALPANAAEEAELLKDHSPGDDGKYSEQEQNAASNPARLSKNVTEISDKDGCEQKNGATPQLEINFPYFRNLAHAHRVVKQMRCVNERWCCLFGYKRERFLRFKRPLREPSRRGSLPNRCVRLRIEHEQNVRHRVGETD
jgi:hypothetical protein